ncbi:MAG: asparagine synthase (glutamine-hydrolyzing) [Bacteroidetes bacterium]|nr:asparagine synthase (glutamine-hydrolyzing) [Bacteroidota bacterium]
MCGIAGFADFKHQSNETQLQGMAACMAHRGPDGQHLWMTQTDKAQLGFAHARLSIIDLSHAADQPMHFEGLSIVFNGEIYNYNEIRDELIALGHSFQTHSDTEVILHGWKEWGPDCIHKWRGMFAIVLHDAEKQELICMRDRAGVKPFHYSFQDGLFLFGSELKCLMAHPRFQKEIDPAAVASFLQYGCVSGAHSIFRNTQKLLPGHILTFNLQTQEITTRQYWNVYDYYNKPKLNIALPEAIEETERILKQSFEYRMVADVPVGVFLSGGYDSTCVTALLQSGRTEKLKTFTIGTTDGKMDEAPFAKEIAQRLGTDHTEYYCSVKEALDIIPTLPQYYDEPFADSSAIPTILVSKMARQKVTVALSADAGDEIFAGYNRYDYISRYGNKLASIPKPLRKMAAAMMEGVSSESIPVLKHKANFHSRYDKLKNLLNDPSPAELLKNLSQVFSDKEIQNLMAAPVPPLKTAHTSDELKPEAYDALSFMMAVDYQTYMVDDILQKVDRATMSVSLEGREPFLDQHIIEWAAQLPSDYKYHKGIKKYPLRQIVHKYVPKEMMDRPKMGFGIPVNDWLQAELKPLVMEYFSDVALSHGLFRKEGIKKLLDEFYTGRTEKYLKLWYLLMFQMWYQKWMSA